MCLAVPMRLVELDGNEAVADAGGVRRKIRVDFLSQPQVGEYVICHAGFAIERLRPEDARETLDLFQAMAE